ncbi:MAG: glutamate racemase [Firmicutes bacterium]|nr:glutamate racemase [Bacillota bacterium]MDD7734329.1 glutamate racemase [Bacillota bacterium]
MTVGRLSPIGVFDSGVGGISVLKEIIKLMPNERYIYYGDSANAPYGVKTDEEVYVLTENVFHRLLDMGAKAVVIACNTATSVAVRKFRLKYPDIPIVGIEPAIKPAAENHKGGRIVVMATSVTLRRQKFADLMDNYAQNAEIIPVPCPGLVNFVEQDRTDSQEMMDYLKERFDPLKDRPIDAVVLGCTHYPFIAEQIREIVGPHAVFYDGGAGVAREIRRRIESKDLLNQIKHGKIDIEIINSGGQDLVDLSKRLLVR